MRDTRLTDSATIRAPFITRILVDDLFGRYKYNLYAQSHQGRKPDLLLLYGENGSGKTTILSLVFHMLSKENAKGHRTFLAKTRFKRLVVDFSDATRLSAHRPRGEAVGSFRLEFRKGKHRHSFMYKVDKDGSIPNLSESPQHTRFATHLPEFTLYFLPDDRKMSAEIELEPRDSTRNLELRHLDRLLVARGEVEGRARVRSEPVLTKLVQWAREQALAGSNQGQLNANSIYSGIVARVVSPTAERQLFQGPDELARTLAEQAVRNHRYSVFGLTSELEVGNLIESVLKSKPKRTRINLIGQILKPFIDGNEAKLQALEPVQRALETFVTNVNRFYTDKKLSFNIRDGVRIVPDGGEAIDPGLLSSGEKQLLILFCNVIMTARKPAIFFIDEPELSLNIKWQRQLVDALLSCVRNGAVQFVLATHSLEILAKHRTEVLRLTNLHRRPASPEANVFGEA